MDRIVIKGGARLKGEIPISGAKNSAIKLMAASLLTDETVRLTNMPRLADTRFLGRLLRRLGAEVEEADGPDGPRYRLLESVAAYGLQRLEQAGESGRLRARHGHRDGQKDDQENLEARRTQRG